MSDIISFIVGILMVSILIYSVFATIKLILGIILGGALLDFVVILTMAVTWVGLEIWWDGI